MGNDFFKSQKQLALIRRKKRAFKETPFEAVYKNEFVPSQDLDGPTSSDLSNWENAGYEGSIKKMVKVESSEDRHENLQGHNRTQNWPHQNQNRSDQVDMNYSLIQNERQNVLLTLSQALEELRSLRLRLQKQNEEPEPLDPEDYLTRLLFSEKYQLVEGNTTQ